MTFGELVVQARNKKGLNQKQLAALIKKENGQPISAPYLNDIEHDRRSPTSDHIIKQFAGALDLEPGLIYIVCGRIPPEHAKADLTLLMTAVRAFQRVLQSGRPDA